MVRRAERRNKGPRMMMGRVLVGDDMKERRIITAAMVRRRLIYETRVERKKWVGVLMLQWTGPIVRWEMMPLRRYTGKEYMREQHLDLKVKRRTLRERRRGGRMKRMTQDARGSQ